MKSIKKLLALALVLVMLTALGATAFAAGTPGITIKPSGTASDDGFTDTTEVAITYTYYKILSASIDTDPVVAEATGVTSTDGVVAYYVENEAQATALSGTGLFTVTKVDGQNKWFVALTDKNTTAEAIVEEFSKDTFLANFTKQTYTKPKGTANAVLPDITAGYYFIKSSIGTKAALQTLSPVTIVEKNTFPELDKVFGTGGTDDTNNFAGVGNVIPYEITVKIPANVEAKPLTIVDTITKGLTLNTSVTVSGGTFTSATFTERTDPAPAEGTKVYIITISAADVTANAGNTLKFSYTATVNKDAVVLEPEKNTGHLEYDNSATPPVPLVKTYPLAIDVQKVDSDGETVLAGAEFKLYDALTGGNEIPVVLVKAAADNNGVSVYRVAVEGETGVAMVGGTFRIEGLNDQDYYLEETKEPTGYNKLTAREKLTVVAPTIDDNGNITAKGTSDPAVIDLLIKNNKGTQLPSTGGIGTTLFYVFGTLLVLGAGVVLVTKRRVRE